MDISLKNNNIFVIIKGSYSFLEFQDPNLNAFQQKQNSKKSDYESKLETSEKTNQKEASDSTYVESAWERGLKHAKEMKEKALKRKEIEKEDFFEKKMNLSLKEFENENDERYLNIEK